MSVLDPTNKSDDAESEAGQTSADMPETDAKSDSDRPREIGGRGGLDPTRYGDWEKAGRCIDF